MSRWAPYRLGIWLADHLRSCYLCHLHTTDYPNKTDQINSASQLDGSVTGRLLCHQCHQAITWLPPEFTIDIAPAQTLVIQSATYYIYPIQQAITAFKHREDMTKLPFLVHALRQIPRPTGCHSRNSVIVPMPTTVQRLRRRGFDPVTILTHYLAQHWRIPIWQGVVRVDNTISQQGLSRAERLTNLDTAFDVIQSPPNAHLLLFDDVATTGASLKALAQTLLSTGHHHQLSAYALAHGNPVK